MSQRDDYNGRLPAYNLPPFVGEPGQIMTVQHTLSGQNFLAWTSTSSSGGQVIRITGGTFTLAPSGGGGTGTIGGTFNLYTDSNVVTVILQSLTSDVAFDTPGGTLVTSTAPFEAYAPASTIWGSMLGVTDLTKTTMGWSVSPTGVLTMYPMYPPGTHGFAPLLGTMIWDYIPAPEERLAAEPLIDNMWTEVSAARDLATVVPPPSLSEHTAAEFDDLSDSLADARCVGSA